MFSNLDKKILIISIVTLIVILLAGFLGYKYILSPEANVQNTVGGIQTETSEEENTDKKNEEPNLPGKEEDNIPDIQNIQIEAEGQGGLIICADKCGDGVCQTADLSCDEKTQLNCTCQENFKECPSDCKQ